MKSHLGGPGSILARGRPPWEGFQWFSFPLQVNTVGGGGTSALQVGHAVYLAYLSYAFISPFIYLSPVHFTVAYNLAVSQRL